MINKNKYIEAFIEALEIKKEKINSKLVYESVPEWDSIGHMTLISAIEEKFNISIETDDVVDFSGYDKGIEILKKYNVKFN